MILSTREDIDAPIEAVFRAVSNFDKHERQLLRRGADVTRLEDRSPPGPGVKWEVTGTFRGKRRTVICELTEYERPNTLGCQAAVGGVDATVAVELLALSPKRTRLSVKMKMKPTTLSSRLLLQSLKLAKNSVEGRFKGRIANFGRDIAERYRKRADA